MFELHIKHDRFPEPVVTCSYKHVQCWVRETQRLMQIYTGWPQVTIIIDLVGDHTATVLNNQQPFETFKFNVS